MALTIINGSNYLGRFFLRNLCKEYSEIRFADMYPFREAVYQAQEDLSLSLVKYPLSYPASLALALEGASTAILFTHDYFKLAHSKNFYLERTAAFAQKAGVKQLVWVAPAEFEQLNPLDGNPSQLTQDAEKRARDSFPELCTLRTDLVFGPSAVSLVLQHTMECLKNGQTLLCPNHGHSKFRPVHHDEVLGAFRALKAGEQQVISGPEELSWLEIVRILAEHTGGSGQGVSGFWGAVSNWIMNNPYVGELFYPSHIQQMNRLLSQDLALPLTTKGQKTLKETLKPQGYEVAKELNWHRVIVD